MEAMNILSKEEEVWLISASNWKQHNTVVKDLEGQVQVEDPVTYQSPAHLKPIYLNSEGALKSLPVMFASVHSLMYYLGSIMYGRLCEKSVMKKIYEANILHYFELIVAETSSTDVDNYKPEEFISPIAKKNKNKRKQLKTNKFSAKKTTAFLSDLDKKGANVCSSKKTPHGIVWTDRKITDKSGLKITLPAKLLMEEKSVRKRKRARKARSEPEEEEIPCKQHCSESDGSQILKRISPKASLETVDLCSLASDLCH